MSPRRPFRSTVRAALPGAILPGYSQLLLSQAQLSSPAGTTALGAAVTTFNSWPLVVRCLEALSAWGGRLARIMVVDDASPGSPEGLPADPRITVRVNESRQGFAAALNRAVTELETDLAVVFDADAYPLADVSEAVCAAFRGEPRLGILGFRTVDAAGRETPSWSSEPRAFSLAAGQRLDGWLRRLLPAGRPREVCIHTAALALRREAFLAVGGADEEMGFLDVDIDLSMRLRRAGWTVRWEPSLVAFHEGGGSPIATSWRVQQLYRSRWRLLRKHGLIRFPALLRTAILLRLSLESLLLSGLGGILFRDAGRRRDKAQGRRELIRLVRRELR